MKKKLAFIIASLIITALAAVFFSCDIPLALGERLDIKGPIVEFESPLPRKAVPVQFEIKGNVSDESPIKELLIKTSRSNEEFAKQWRYTRSAGWQVSENYGNNWTEYPDAQWDGDEKSAKWTLPVDLSVGGVNPEDGEYTFSAQAWDSGGFTDDNSFKTLVLIYDKEPPKVEVYNPFLYDRFQYDGIDFKGELKELADAATWKDPSLLGKFLVQEFQLQWQIEDQHDVWSIELLFYEHTANIDGLVETDVPEDYIYYYHENLPPPELDPARNIKPNGSVLVPNLGGPPGQYNGGTLGKTVTDKTVIKVVSRCFDAAGWVNEEKVLGYFIFWPQAIDPWITFTDGMEDFDYYAAKTYATDKDFEADSFMIYPGRSIKATAFQAQGVSKVEFSLHNYNWDTKAIGEPMPLSYLERDDVVIKYAPGYGDTRLVLDNAARPNGSFSTIFPWDFRPPPRTGNYVIKATAFDSNGKPSDEHWAVFRVQDISFPDFPVSPSPAASEPLFKAISGGNITISGYVSDATEISSLYIVWINPESRNWAAMSQLSYFRDADYVGWTKAINANLLNGKFVEEDEYDELHPNKVWRVDVDRIGEDDGRFNKDNTQGEPEIFSEDHEPTYRQIYEYSLVVNIANELNIAPGRQPLISQMFLLRAQNPDLKTNIITYAPQGDTVYPTITIDEVRVIRGSSTTTCKPGEYQQVPQFENLDRIEVDGKWTEDSTQILPIQTYLTPNVKFEINRETVTGTLSPAIGNATGGTFRINVTVGAQPGNIGLASMKDTLTVNATIQDIGGNPAEVGNSWLIESDTLRFLRITSLEEDRAYKQDETIDIFIEFNKPVTLKYPGSNPVLILNTTGGVTAVAEYKPGQTTENVRQFFTYTVKANQNTPTNPIRYLDVSGISIDGGTTSLAQNNTEWQQPDYHFTWEHKPMMGNPEEIRLTRTAAHNGGSVTANGSTFYARAIPVASSPSTDVMFTLGGGKRIIIDNTPPAISSISASPTGWHKAGTDIYITATFNKPVQITGIPYLVLNTGGTSPNNRTTNVAGDVRVNNNQITFKYTVKAGDTAVANDLQVTGFGDPGTIQDIPGTPMTTFTTRTLTGVRLDTAAPSEPTITVYNAANQGGTTLANTSPNTPLTYPLGNLYHNDMSFRITGTTGDQHYKNLEYTLDGTTWTIANGSTYNGTLANGRYTIQARQTDNAGNVSSVTKSVTLNLDRGTPLVTNITSFTANGTYTNNTARPNDRIEIQVNFRKALTFSGEQSITLNVTGGAAGSNVITLNPPPTGAVSQLSFIYTVASGHTTAANTRLAVTALNLNATDSNGATPTPAQVTVPQAILNTLPTANNQLLQGSKEIYIVTGGLTVTTQPAFNNGSLNGATAGVQTDGSYNTALTVTFNRPIFKNAGNITIMQSPTNYRVPAVLTEAQYNKYRDKNILNFNTYYTRGTNGYIGNDTVANGAPDTSTKFVLAYDFDPVSPTAGAQTTFTEAFRQAEAITLSVNSSAVRIVNTATTGQLIVDLAGVNALQVPGASYIVTIDANFVQDSLSNRSLAISRTGNDAPSIGGVAKPFIRVFKKQDTIAVSANPSATVPRFVATQPLSTTVRMDTRTPGARIYYIANTLDGSVTTAPAAPGNFAIPGGPTDNNNNPTRPADPGTTTTGRSLYNGEVTIGGTINGNDISLTNVQGLKWHVRANATTTDTGPVNGTWSGASEEMAYRTVLTYAINAMSNAAPGQNFTQYNGNNNTTGTGKQVWIRGGNAIEVSTIPGFPLTWQDDWETLRSEGRRAGIRLLTLVTPPATNMNTSTWRWVTWEVNVDTYFDMILGNDPDSADGTTGANVANIVTQYGPRQWTTQRAGWTAYKEQIRIFAGKHRYLRVESTEQQTGGTTNRGAINFSLEGSTRPVMSVVTWPAP